MILKRISYSDLNSRQQENYNFHKVAGYLADFGFNSIKLTDDWRGADFLACHIDGQQFLKIQLKGRFSLDKKYVGKDLYIAFLHREDCYIYPHDEVMAKVLERGQINDTVSWAERGLYNWPSIPKWALDLLEPYRVNHD